jgi:uncharacterized membrane protein YwzB
MSFFDDMGIGLIILIVAILLVIVFAWWWLVWICVGILIEHFKLPGGILMHIFLWIVVNSIIGGIGKIGTSKS